MALPAGDFSIGGFWSGFYFNNLMERFAVRAEEQWLAGRHRPGKVNVARLMQNDEPMTV
jgi:hypothetical protein